MAPAGIRASGYSPAALHLPHPGLAGLVRLGDRVTGRPVYEGNRIEPLVDGDAAYPAMLAAIEAATQSVFHLHVHLVPRWQGDAIGPIWPRACAEGPKAAWPPC